MEGVAPLGFDTAKGAYSTGVAGFDKRLGV
jgi:hypothetical protein